MLAARGLLWASILLLGLPLLEGTTTAPTARPTSSPTATATANSAKTLLLTTPPIGNDMVLGVAIKPNLAVRRGSGLPLSCPLQNRRTGAFT